MKRLIFTNFSGCIGTSILDLNKKNQIPVPNLVVVLVNDPIHVIPIVVLTHVVLINDPTHVVPIVVLTHDVLTVVPTHVVIVVLTHDVLIVVPTHVVLIVVPNLVVIVVPNLVVVVFPNLVVVVLINYDNNIALHPILVPLSVHVDFIDHINHNLDPAVLTIIDPTMNYLILMINLPLSHPKIHHHKIEGDH